MNLTYVLLLANGHLLFCLMDHGPIKLSWLNNVWLSGISFHANQKWLLYIQTARIYNLSFKLRYCMKFFTMNFKFDTGIARSFCIWRVVNVTNVVTLYIHFIPKLLWIPLDFWIDSILKKMSETVMFMFPWFRGFLDSETLGSLGSIGTISALHYRHLNDYWTFLWIEFRPNLEARNWLVDSWFGSNSWSYIHLLSKSYGLLLARGSNVSFFSVSLYEYGEWRLTFFPWVNGHLLFCLMLHGPIKLFILIDRCMDVLSDSKD